VELAGRYAASQLCPEIHSVVKLQTPELPQLVKSHTNSRVCREMKQLPLVYKLRAASQIGTHSSCRVSTRSQKVTRGLANADRVHRLSPKKFDADPIAIGFPARLQTQTHAIE